jgi:ABC-2 type transport system ATP-binding protein
LIERLEIDPSRRSKEYSKGNKQKIGLVIALQHRPDLLILDEPTSGLDPLVQQTSYALVREARAEGRTVFLSSHILSEVERTGDRVAIIREGQLVKVDRIEALRDLAHHQVELRFADGAPVAEFERLPGVGDLVAEDHVIRMRVAGPITPVVQAAARYELLDFVSREPTLEETVLAQYGDAPVEVASHDR